MHRTLQLHSPSKELTPAKGTVPAATKEIGDDAVAVGEETQQVEMVVADVEENEEEEKTPDIELDAEREKADLEHGECLIHKGIC